MPSEQTDIAALSNFGIATSDIKKLREAGFHTVEHLMMTSDRKLLNIKGISDAKVLKMKEAAAKLGLQLLDFTTGKDLLRLREDKIVKVTTGCQDLDDILGGGIESSSITEVYGEFRSGKSQLAMTVAVASFLPRDIGGGEGRTMYLDTEGSFRPERWQHQTLKRKTQHTYMLQPSQ